LQTLACRSDGRKNQTREILHLIAAAGRSTESGHRTARRSAGHVFKWRGPGGLYKSNKVIARTIAQIYILRERLFIQQIERSSAMKEFREVTVKLSKSAAARAAFLSAGCEIKNTVEFPGGFILFIVETALSAAEVSKIAFPYFSNK
jgi:hypothetical protein